MKIRAGKNIVVQRSGENVAISTRDSTTKTAEVDNTILTIAEISEGSSTRQLNNITDEWEDSGVQQYASINEPDGATTVQNPPVITNESLVISAYNSNDDRLDFPLWGTSDELKDLRDYTESSADNSEEDWEIEDGTGVQVSVITGLIAGVGGPFYALRVLTFNSTGNLVSVSQSYTVEIPI